MDKNNYATKDDLYAVKNELHEAIKNLEISFDEKFEKVFNLLLK